MHGLDLHVHPNALCRVHPRSKAALAFLAVAACLALERPWVGLLTMTWMFGLTTAWARIHPARFLRAVGSGGAFLAISTCGVLLGVSLDQPTGALGEWRLGGIWFSVSASGLEQAVRLFCRALGCLSALVFLILTTSFSDLVGLARTMRLPSVITDLLVITYRGIYLLVDAFSRIRRAQEARLGYSGFRSSMRSLGLLCSQVLVAAHQRGLRQHAALEARCANGGPLTVLPSVYETHRGAVWIGAALLGSLLAVGLR